jgi:hypothetical protein
VAETPLYSERQVFPWRLWGVFLVGMVAVCVVVGLTGDGSLANDVWLFVVGIGAVAFWFAWIWIAMRLSPVRLNARTLRLPWRPAIPLEKIERAEIVEGEELTRIRRELERGSRGLPAGASAAAIQGVGAAGLNLAQAAIVRSMRNDPVLKGLVATSANRSAIYLETDPSVGLTRRWLIGTRHPREFMARLQAGIAAAKAAQPPSFSSVIPRDERGRPAVRDD